MDKTKGFKRIKMGAFKCDYRLKKMAPSQDEVTKIDPTLANLVG